MSRRKVAKTPEVVQSLGAVIIVALTPANPPKEGHSLASGSIVVGVQLLTVTMERVGEQLVAKLAYRRS